MSINATTLRKLAALGLSPEQMTGVLDILADGAEAEEARLSAQRERTRRAREKQRGNVTVSLQQRYDRGDDTRGGVTRVEDKTLPLEIEPQKKEQKETRAGALRSEFNTVFWPEYPNKVGKPKALAAFVAARSRSDLAPIMAGLARYISSKPPDRPWLNPATFLNQDRFNDAPAPVARGSPPGPRINPTLVAARQLMEQFNAVSPSDLEGNHPPPRLVAIGSR